MYPKFERAAKDGDLAIVSVSQGRTAAKTALPRQTEATRLALLSGARDVTPTVDTDGERGIAFYPASHGAAVTIGRRFGQRSVLVGPNEIATEDGRVLTRFMPAKTSDTKPDGFYTLLPGEGLFISYSVKPHMRAGRPVVGYATRRTVRRARR